MALPRPSMEEERSSAAITPSSTVTPSFRDLLEIPHYDRDALEEIIVEIIANLSIDPTVNTKITACVSNIEQAVFTIRRFSSKKRLESFYGATRDAMRKIRNNADFICDLANSICDPTKSSCCDALSTALKALIVEWIRPLETELERRLEMSEVERAALKAKTKQLYAEQSFITRQRHLQIGLMQHLDQLRLLLKDPIEPPVRCYISYAWPSRENQEREYWVKPFLSILYDHLTAVGIRMVMDIRDNQPGDSIFQFMRQYHDGNHIILVGTESLLQKHYSVIPHAVQTELNIIVDKAKEDQEQFGRSRIYPMLISGTIKTAYPEIYDKYRTVRDTRNEGYLGTLKALTDWIYRYRLDSVKQKHINLWRTFDESLRGRLPNNLSTSKQEIARGHHRQPLYYLRQDIEYESVQAQSTADGTAAGSSACTAAATPAGAREAIDRQSYGDGGSDGGAEYAGDVASRAHALAGRERARLSDAPPIMLSARARSCVVAASQIDCRGEARRAPAPTPVPKPDFSTRGDAGPSAAVFASSTAGSTSAAASVAFHILEDDETEDSDFSCVSDVADLTSASRPGTTATGAGAAGGGAPGIAQSPPWRARK
jgi:hypothetical protein